MTQNNALLQHICETLDKHGGKNIQTLPIPTPFLADFFVLATCTSQRHIKTLAEHVQKSLKSTRKKARITTDPESGWGLVDLNDIIVHLFLEDARAHYNLEDLWCSSVNTIK